MGTMLIGKAALTVIRLTNGTRANIAQGRAVPESILPDDAKRLVDEGFLEEIDVVDSAGVELAPSGIVLDDGLRIDATGAVVNTSGDVLVPGREDDDEEELELQEPSEPLSAERVAEISALNVEPLLDEVGDDQVHAAQVLEAELAKGTPRKGVVDGLQAVLADDEAPA